MNKINILATGHEFLKEGIRGTGPVIEELIEEAKNEIQMMAFVISPRAERILNLLEDALSRGIKMTLIINYLSEHEESVKQRFSLMRKKYPQLKIVDFQRPEGNQLHAKVLVVDRKKAVLGSANFSIGGMTKNYEIGVMVEGDAAWKLGKLIDDLSL